MSTHIPSNSLSVAIVIRALHVSTLSSPDGTLLRPYLAPSGVYMHKIRHDKSGYSYLDKPSPLVRLVKVYLVLML
jgi:hypothetical protein